LTSSLPHGWRRVRLGDVANVRTGVTKNSHALKNPLVRPYLRVANVQNGRIDLSHVKTIAIEQSAAGRFELRSGDVLMTEGGDFDKLGRGAVWQGEIEGCLHQNHVFAVRPHESELLAEYLAAWTASSEGRRYFTSCSKQTTNLASINTSQVRAAPLVLPSIAEQRELVQVFAGLRRVVTCADRLILEKERFKRGLMHELLTGRRRLPGFQREWTEFRMGELFAERVESGRADLPLLSITGDRGVVPRENLERKDTSNVNKDRYLRIAPGDIGYNTMRMWQGVSALSALEGIVSPAYTVIVPGTHIDGHFAANLFKFPSVVNLFRRNSQGLVDDTLSLKFHHFARIRLRFPPIEEQRAISSVFAALDREIEVLAKLLPAVKRQEGALLDKFLSGELRLLPK
jgi:type I restriction enzyme, S subunit